LIKINFSGLQGCVDVADSMEIHGQSAYVTNVGDSQFSSGAAGIGVGWIASIAALV